MSYTDSQLIRRCRSLRQMRKHQGTDLEGPAASLQRIRCPPRGASRLGEEGALAKKLQTFRGRAEAHRCQDPRGMWLDELGDFHRCVIVTVGIVLGFRPGHLVLDWGSGCAHKLTWAKVLFDVDGLGVEVAEAAVSWARAHSAGKFCHADGRNLSWIPDGMFDFVFSYGALYLLTDVEQCATGRQLLQKLRVGGRAFLGWNRANEVGNLAWRRCFATSNGPSQVEVEELEDGLFFAPNEQLASNAAAYRYPLYSLLLTRTG